LADTRSSIILFRNRSAHPLLHRPHRCLLFPLGAEQDRECLPVQGGHIGDTGVPKIGEAVHPDIALGLRLPAARGSAPLPGRSLSTTRSSIFPSMIFFCRGLAPFSRKRVTRGYISPGSQWLAWRAVSQQCFDGGAGGDDNWRGRGPLRPPEARWRRRPGVVVGRVGWGFFAPAWCGEGR